VEFGEQIVETALNRLVEFVEAFIEEGEFEELELEEEEE
jgi:hypothetical protein